ncbi:MAG: 3-hydroxyacyl-CoA dehydrogenase family protein [Chloroflexi bacterium]|nr:3-hydroxyacyl-CoA dehydrogenase family protein [Chloroflexota bacterium]
MYVFKAAVIGAGTMGVEIAQVISWSELPVILKDVNDELVQKGLQHAQTIYQRRVDKGKMSAQQMRDKMDLIIPATTYDDFTDVDFVIEAVPEKMEIKKKVFAELDEACPSHAILATNTSALSISEMADATRRPDKVVGFHFFYPASVMKLIEVVAGQATSEDTLDTAVSFAESLRKIAVRVKECPGFLVNRILMASMIEAIRFQEETGATMEEMDLALREGAGLPIGPFLLADTLGLDIVYDVAVTLEEAYGERFKAPESLRRLIEARHLGIKTGQGFYAHTG